ncbi:Beta-glucosidase [Fusarium sp. LHS14.1]|nr:Beta-glucosidase [Fusarium sp. LHS14.1]
MRHSDPWTFMASYNKINRVHSSESPLLLKTILRDEWGFKGLVMSEWFGTYSTSESVNAGMDLEMPGPTLWRGKALSHAVNCRKVSHQAIDNATRNVLALINKTKAVENMSTPPESDSQEQRALIRKIASEGIVLLKNDNKILPVTDVKGKNFGLIGDHVKHPAVCGGGSSEVEPYYSITPYDAIVEEVGEANVSCAPGCYTFRYSPLLQRLSCPKTDQFGWSVEIFGENPDENPNAEPVLTTVAEKPLIDVPENLALPRKYFVRARSIFTHQASKQFCFGFGVSGKGLLKVDGKVVIDQWTDQLPKTDSTPCYDRLCMEKFCTVDVTKTAMLLEVVMVNENISGGVGTALTLAGRVGGFEPFDEDQGIRDAVELAKNVDVAIIVTGLSSDWEFEGSDRKHLRLPGRTDDLIQAVLEANPNTIVVTQSGCPIEMPWEDRAATVPDVFQGRLDIVYGEGVFIGHRYHEMVDQDALFWFGHGLSYSTFTYKDLKVPKQIPGGKDGSMKVSLTVTNVGPYDGAEVIQVYVQDPESTLQRPIKEPKAFTKVYLACGESKTVQISLDRYSLSFWSQECSKWKAEAGEYVVIIASSSDPKDEIMRASFHLSETYLWEGL